MEAADRRLPRADSEPWPLAYIPIYVACHAPARKYLPPIEAARSKRDAAVARTHHRRTRTDGVHRTKVPDDPGDAEILQQLAAWPAEGEEDEPAPVGAPVRRGSFHHQPADQG